MHVPCPSPSRFDLNVRTACNRLQRHIEIDPCNRLHKFQTRAAALSSSISSDLFRGAFDTSPSWSSKLINAYISIFYALCSSSMIIVSISPPDHNPIGRAPDHTVISHRQGSRWHVMMPNPVEPAGGAAVIHNPGSVNADCKAFRLLGKDRFPNLTRTPASAMQMPWPRSSAG